MVEHSHAAGWWPNLSQPLRQMGQTVSDWFAPATEASKDESTYEINVELPGVKAEDVDVTVHENTLMVRGEKRAERKEEGKDFYFSERQYGSFQRTFRLPPDADSENVDASFVDGVLRVKIAKEVPAERTEKKIEIRSE